MCLRAIMNNQVNKNIQFPMDWFSMRREFRMVLILLFNIHPLWITSHLVYNIKIIGKFFYFLLKMKIWSFV
jgi:hypothetical protein